MLNHEILIIDDESAIRSSLEGALKDEGYRVRMASSGAEGLSAVRHSRPDVILLDIWMPGQDGLTTLQLLKQDDPDLLVIMMTGHGTIETAVRATKLGAFDFIEKPLSLEKLLLILQNAIGMRKLSLENEALRKQINRAKVMVGQSSVITQIMERIQLVAPSTGSVLITGENGTGKELVAHHIHALSPRYARPMVEVNCAAIPEDLIESELFGHEKGAFTGAHQTRRGKFDLADGGTLFLDEIGDMSLRTQAKLLRILQEQKFERVGGTQPIQVDVRVIAATNKDLKSMIAGGTFREDLFYRLNVVRFNLPPLRERVGDVGILFNHFMRELASLNGKRERPLTPDGLEALQNYRWPGNVRELHNLVERLVILTPVSADGSPVTGAVLFNHLHDDSGTPSVSSMESGLGSFALGTESRDLKAARQEFEKEFILRTLRENNWNVSKAAVVLGLERTYLHRKMKSFGIESED